MDQGFRCYIVVNADPLVERCDQTKISAEQIGITKNFRLTSKLYFPLPILISRERFLRLNRAIVERERNSWTKTVQDYRDYYRDEALRKHRTLSYSFHISIYCRPRISYLGLRDALKRNEVNTDVVAIPEFARSGMIYLFERLIITNQSKVHRWWYVLINSHSNTGTSSGYISNKILLIGG